MNFINKTPWTAQDILDMVAKRKALPKFWDQEKIIRETPLDSNNLGNAEFEIIEEVITDESKLLNG